MIATLAIAYSNPKSEDYIIMSNKFITKEFSIEKGTGRLSPIRLRPRDKKALENNDAIYIYLGPKNVYVGQTKHFFSRHKQHVQESNHRYING